MTIYNRFIGIPSPKIPDNAKLIYSQSLQYQSGTQMIEWYSDDPTNAYDIAEIEDAKNHTKEVNNRDVPIWV